MSVAAKATDHELAGQLHRFGRRHQGELEAALHTFHQNGKARHVSLSLLLAVGSVETGLQNDATDFGHGRGVFQQDDRDSANKRWLRFHKGCNSGSYVARYRSALPSGRVPTLASGAKRFILDYADHVRYVRAEGVPIHAAWQVGLASYNCGPTAAARGYFLGDCDRYTATQDYTRRAYARAAIFHELVKR